MPCLSVTSGDDYKVIWHVFQVLFIGAYNKFGSKLIESNVRSFYRFEGKTQAA